MATVFDCDMAGFDGFNWDRQGVTLHMAGLGVGATGANMRGGVVPALGNPLGYVLSAGMVGTLKAGRYLLPAPDPANGVYELVLPADFAITHTTSNVTNPRTDLIIAEVNDQGTSASTSRFRLLSGTAGAGTPALPTSLGNGAAVSLASVSVPAGATSLSTITDLRTWTAGAGGVVPVVNAAAAASLPVGTPYYDLSADRAGLVRAAGATPLTLDGTAWGEVKRDISLAQTGIANTTIGTDFAAGTTVNMTTGGLVDVTLTADVQLSGQGSMTMRIVGHTASEHVFLDNQRTIGRCHYFGWAPAGTLSLNMEQGIATAAGAGATIFSVKWLVSAQGGVT